MKRFSLDDLRTQIIAILTAWGMPTEKAEITAEVMIDTDLSGIDSHGISMLMMYENLIREGRLDVRATPEVVLDGPAYALIEGHHGLGHPTGVRAIHLAIDKARASGVGMVVAGGSAHFGALGYYARIASSQGLIALITSTTRTPVSSATGGTSPVLGTNPLAFSAPRSGGEPLVVDMSSSVVALNKVKTYALKGEPLPLGWVIDRAGAPVTDASAAFGLLTSLGATISPLGGPSVLTGGHKGFGLSLMVQVLSAALSGAELPAQPDARENLGHFFLVIDPDVFGPPGAAADYVAALCASLQRDEPGVLIPGEPEQRSRIERGATGVPLAASLLEQLQAICLRADIPCTLT